MPTVITFHCNNWVNHAALVVEGKLISPPPNTGNPHILSAYYMEDDARAYEFVFLPLCNFLHKMIRHKLLIKDASSRVGLVPQ